MCLTRLARSTVGRRPMRPSIPHIGVGHCPQGAGGGEGVQLPGNLVPDRTDIRRA